MRGITKSNLLKVLVLTVAVALAGCGGGGGAAPSPGGGNKINGQAVPIGPTRVQGAERAAAAYPAGKTVRLYKITSAGEYVRTGLEDVADVKIGSDGRFTFLNVPSGAANLVVRCINCDEPISMFVPAVTSANMDIGVLTEENDAEQKTLREMLVAWAGSVAPGDINFQEIRALITAGDATSILDYDNPLSTPAAMVSFAQGLKERIDVEQSTLVSLGVDFDAVKDIVKGVLEELYADLADGTITSLAELEEQLAIRLAELEAAGTLPAGFTRQFLEARSKGYEILDSNIETSPFALAGDLDGARADVEGEKFRQRCEEELARIRAIIDRLNELAAVLPAASNIDKDALVADIRAAVDDFKAAADSASSPDDVAVAFEIFKNKLKNVFDRILQALGISPQTFDTIIGDLKQREAAFRDAVAAAETNEEYEAAIENFKAQTESILNSVRYLLVQAFPGLADSPDKLEQLTRVAKELLRIIALRDFPLPPPIIGPPPEIPEGITGLEIEPAAATIAVGATQRFMLYGTTATGERIAIERAIWYVSADSNSYCGDPSGINDPTFCMPDIGYIDEKGLFTALAPGSGQVVAVLELYSAIPEEPMTVLTATANITVTDDNPPPADLVSLTIDPESAGPFLVGQNQQFTAYGVRENGEKVAVRAKWIVESDTPIVDPKPGDIEADCGGYTDPNTDAPIGDTVDCLPPGGIEIPPVGYIDYRGLFTAIAPGAGAIVAVLERDGDQPPLIARILIKVLPVDAIHIEPQNPQVEAGGTILFKAFAEVNGALIPLNSVYWYAIPLSSSGGPVDCGGYLDGGDPGTMPPIDCMPAGWIDGDGLFTAYSAGQMLVVATLPSPDATGKLIQDATVVTIAGGQQPTEGVDVIALPETIWFDPPTPDEGEPATISITIVNKGPETATDIKVNFIDTSDGMLDVIVPIGSVTIASLAAGDFITVSVVWDTTGQMGGNYIQVEAVAEGDNYPDNNLAWGYVHVVCPAGQFMDASGACSSDISAAFIYHRGRRIQRPGRRLALYGSSQ